IRRKVYGWIQLSHDNILPLEGVTEGFGPLPALVTPWMENGSLNDYLKREVNLSLEKKFNMAREVAAGLQYLHKQDIVHGNLTGDNILLDASGRARNADFSHSVILAEADSRIFSEQLPGDARYISPECIASGFQTGIPKPTKAGDVYSYGCLMFLQVLEGKIPYHYINRYEHIICLILTGTMPKKPPTSVVIDTDWDFIEKCWSKDAERRPSDEDILKFVEGRAGICS
ncbi:kinase-like domain-containing protein, partial [Suillus placidus]